MSNTSTRVNVTVTIEQRDLLAKLVDLRGGSMAGHLRLMLDHATPTLRALIPILEEANAEMEHFASTVQLGAQALLEEALGEEQLDDDQIDWVRAVMETDWNKGGDACSNRSPSVAGTEADTDAL